MKIITSAKLRLITKLPAQEKDEAILLLAMELEKEERRLSRNRYYTQKWRDAKSLNLNEIAHGEMLNGKSLIMNDIPHGEPHGEVSSHGEISVSSNLQKSHGDLTVSVPILSKKVSKEESKKDSRHVSAKRSQIPIDLVCSEKNASDALRIGLPQELVANEWQKFHDHHLAKGTLGVDWNAAWRRWCQNHLDWNKPKPQSAAKPLTFREATIIGNRRMIRDLIAAEETSANLETPLGGTSPKLISSNGHATDTGNGKSDGGSYGGLFGKGFG